MKTKLYIILLSIICVGFSIPKSTNYYSKYTVESFFESGLADEKLTLNETNIELLNATLFFTVNQFRKAKGKSELKHSPELQKLAQKYMENVETRPFKNPQRIRKKLMKTVYKDAKKKGYTGTLLNINPVQQDAIDYDGGEFFYNKKDDTTELHLFYGAKPRKSDKNKERQVIPNHTYKSFALSLVSKLSKGDEKKITFDKSYEAAGYYLQWDYKTLYKKKIPQIKMVQIVGGYQTSLLKDLEE